MVELLLILLGHSQKCVKIQILADDSNKSE